LFSSLPFLFLTLFVNSGQEPLNPLHLGVLAQGQRSPYLRALSYKGAKVSAFLLGTFWLPWPRSIFKRRNLQLRTQFSICFFSFISVSGFKNRPSPKCGGSLNGTRHGKETRQQNSCGLYEPSCLGWPQPPGFDEEAKDHLWGPTGSRVGGPIGVGGREDALVIPAHYDAMPEDRTCQYNVASALKREQGVQGKMPVIQALILLTNN
jgi:hypothetical protein